MSTILFYTVKAFPADSVVFCATIFDGLRVLFQTCARYMSSKIARIDPAWNPSIAGRELLKPKFYDVWFEISGKDQVLQPKFEVEAATDRGERLSSRLPRCPRLSGEKWRCMGSADPFGKHHVKDCSNTMREMQRLMHVQLEVCHQMENITILFWD